MGVRGSRAVRLAVAMMLVAWSGVALAQVPGAVPVQVATATRQDVPVLLRNIGTVQALNMVLVRARVDGTLDRVAFTEGQMVKAGQLLAQIDPRPYAAAYAQAVAKRAVDVALLANAQRDLGRYSNLARSDFASRQQVDTQQATVAQTEASIQGDEAAMAAAKLNLEFASITSPIDGRVGIRLIDPGNLIHATDAQGIVTVTQITPISVIFTLPQENLPEIQAAMARGQVPVFAYASDDKTRLASGSLLTIDSQVDTSTATIKLKATFPNADARLWPGQFVNARMQVAMLQNVVTVPSGAIQRGPNGLFIFTATANNTVAVQPVSVQQDEDGVAVVSKGIADGARVVVAGQSRLQAGTPVTVTSAPSGV